MKIAIYGGDGYIGWPLALNLSQDHEVIIIDNCIRRKKDHFYESLVPIYSIQERIEAWHKDIKFIHGDATIFDLSDQLIKSENPDVIIHLAEQRSAPYSMKSEIEKLYTIDNNTKSTHNILAAMTKHDSKAHLIHFGSMGSYGYQGIAREQIDISMDVSSLYHLSKCQDSLLLNFYNNNDKLKISEVRPGVIYGFQTDLTKMDKKLFNRVEYDSVFGTFVNRFLIQAIYADDTTVYGSGEQLRCILNLDSCINAIKLIIDKGGNEDEVYVYNTFDEISSVLEVAYMIHHEYDNGVFTIDNPRGNEENHSYKATNQNLLNLGWNTYRLKDCIQSIGSWLLLQNIQYDSEYTYPEIKWNKHI